MYYHWHIGVWNGHCTPPGKLRISRVAMANVNVLAK